MLCQPTPEWPCCTDSGLPGELSSVGDYQARSWRLEAATAGLRVGGAPCQPDAWGKGHTILGTFVAYRHSICSHCFKN